MAKHCGAGKLESTGEALVALAGVVSAAVLCHLSNGDGGEGEDDGGDSDAGAGVAGLAASAAWLPGLLAEPLLRALSSGPHAKRMAQAAAALGAVLTAAEAAERMPAVVALAQRCLAALLSMGALPCLPPEDGRGCVTYDVACAALPARMGHVPGSYLTPPSPPSPTSLVSSRSRPAVRRGVPPTHPEPGNTRAAPHSGQQSEVRAAGMQWSARWGSEAVHCWWGWWCGGGGGGGQRSVTGKVPHRTASPL